MYALHFSLRKRPMVRQFLGRDDVNFVRTANQIPDGAVVALRWQVWRLDRSL